MKNFCSTLARRPRGKPFLGATAQAITALQGGFGGPLQLNPDPSVAWVMAAGFLGLVVLRRTRSGPMN